MSFRPLISVSLLILAACKPSTPSPFQRGDDAVASPRLHETSSSTPTTAPDSVAAPPLDRKDAPSDQTDPSDEERVRELELEWVGQDEARKTLLANAKPLADDDCVFQWDERADTFRLGRRPTMNAAWELDPDGGQPVFFPGVRTGDIGSPVKVFSLPRPDGTLLVAFGDSVIADNTALGTLWRLDCKAPRAAPTRFYVEPNAEFGYAVASLEGDSIYFPNASGISRLTLADRSVEPLLERPALDPTWYSAFAQDTGTTHRLLYPHAISPEGLVVLAGYPSTHSHDAPELEPWLVDLSDPAVRADPHRWLSVRPISSVVEGPDGVIWLAEWGDCDAVKTPWSYGHVWRSLDGGLTFTPFALNVVDLEDSRWLAVATILVDPMDKRRLVARAPICSSGGRGSFGGNIFVSKDGGRSWRLSALERLGSVEDGLGASHLWSVDGTFARLRIAGRSSDEKAGFAEPWVVRESQDGGQTWEAVEGADVPSAVGVLGPLRLAKAKGITLEVRKTGLFRRLNDGPAEHVFPTPHASPRLVLRNRPLEPERPRRPISWDEHDRAITANMRGLDLARRKQFDAAIEAYAEAIAINPNHAVARYNAACAHSLAGRSAEALDQLEALSEMGGFSALSLLAAAPSDMELKALRKLERFKALTLVAKPRSAYVPADIYPLEAEFPETASDRAERLCLANRRVDDESDEPRLVYDRFDCDSGAHRGVLSASAEEVDRRLDDLGIVPWGAVNPDAPEQAKLLAWAKERLSPSKLDPASTRIFLSPSGHFVMANASIKGAEGHNRHAVIYGTDPTKP